MCDVHLDNCDHDVNLLLMGFCPDRSEWGKECKRCVLIRATFERKKKKDWDSFVESCNRK